MCSTKEVLIIVLQVLQWQPEAEPGAYSDDEAYSDTEEMPEGEHPGMGNEAKQKQRYGMQEVAAQQDAVNGSEQSGQASRKRTRQA